MFKRILTLALTSLLAGCVSMEIEVNLPEGRTQAARFYFGDGHVDDLLILGGRNHYGRLRYPINQPTGDLRFEFLSGASIRARCVEFGWDTFGQPICNGFEVTQSNFQPIPVGSRASRPKGVPPQTAF